MGSSMRFNNRNAQELYYILYWLYLGLSIFCSLLSVVLLLVYYLTNFLDLFNLFLLLIIVLGAIYFRMNALYYHRILIENENRGEFIGDSVKLFSSFHPFGGVKKKLAARQNSKNNKNRKRVNQNKSARKRKRGG